MHFYGKVSERHPYIILGIGVLSFASAYVLYLALTALRITVPFYLDSPSTLGFFGFWYWLFDIWVWRTRFGQFLLNHACDNFAGEYSGEIESTFDSSTPIQCSLTVRQTYCKISVILKSGKSQSKSISACIAEGFGSTQLHYVYQNYPFSYADKDMHSHSGTAMLEFKGSLDKIYMEYYTGRDRTSHGHGTLTRVMKQ